MVYDKVERFLGLEPVYGRIPRIVVVASIFIVAALRGDSRNNLDPILASLGGNHTGNAADYIGASTNSGGSSPSSSSYNCFSNGSLHELALDMFHYSSPPGSKSYTKLKRVLDSNTEFYIDLGGDKGIFTRNTESITRMLRGYGLQKARRVPSYQNNNVTLVETLFTRSPCTIGDEKCRNVPRIFIQTEQYFKPHIYACHESPDCIIIDFAEFNYVKAQHDGIAADLFESFVLLPIMHQNPSRISEYEPPIPVTLSNRTVDISFFGEMTNRRKFFAQEGGKYKESHPGRHVVIQKNHRIAFVAHHYKESKVCLLAHSYNSKSGGEYHRLSEFARFGCVPVMEHFSDRIGLDVYEQCAEAVFENSTNLIGAAADVIAKIDEGLYDGRERRMVDWWKTGVHWERILPTVFG
mmetsp:Transcript_29690/g.62511  ORF Transcript_29690/g.62511 Transcript_29690/m.62511 type:complete len:409 (+) Transcript_29690:119-1345(+)